MTSLVSKVAGVSLAIGGIFLSETVLAQECPLTAPLVLKDTQDGFAGQTGTVWTIGPSCEFAVAKQIGPKVNEPYRQGRLTPQQQTQLKEVLTRTALENIPEKLDHGGPQVNARRVTISYGGKVSELTLAPSGGDLSTLRATVGNGPAGRLLELAETLKGMTGG
jgi:hypothetical protein